MGLESSRGRGYQAENSLWGLQVPVLSGLCWVTAGQPVLGRLLSWGAGRGGPHCEDSGANEERDSGGM